MKKQEAARVHWYVQTIPNSFASTHLYICCSCTYKAYEVTHTHARQTTMSRIQIFANLEFRQEHLSLIKIVTKTHFGLTILGLLRPPAPVSLPSVLAR
jgi:hypothetical protein